MSEFLGGTIVVLLGATVFLLWLTHVIVCLMTASWGFLIAGAILFPIGIIHGALIWLGAM